MSTWDDDARDAYEPQGRVGWGQGFDDYRAATQDMAPADRPSYVPDEWRDDWGRPQTPGWADDSGQAAEPIGQCGTPGCACAYGGRCPNAADPYEPGAWF